MKGDSCSEESCREVSSIQLQPWEGPWWGVETYHRDPPSKGKWAPNLFYCGPTDDTGGPCNAPGGDGHGACMLQLQRKKKTNNGQEVKHQDDFRCTITCGYCGKSRHYEDECHIKKEEERCYNAGKGKPEGAGQNPGGFPSKGNSGGGRNSSAPPTGGRGSSSPTPRGEQLGGKWTVPSIPTAGSAEKNQNTKKHKLNWPFKCLRSAAGNVKFSEEG